MSPLRVEVNTALRGTRRRGFDTASSMRADGTLQTHLTFPLYPEEVNTYPSWSPPSHAFGR